MDELKRTFKRNYIQFQLTGEEKYKIAYENALEELDDYDEPTKHLEPRKKLYSFPEAPAVTAMQPHSWWIAGGLGAVAVGLSLL